LAGGSLPNGRFSSILTADPFTATVLNSNPTFFVSAFETFFVQATATTI